MRGIGFVTGGNLEKFGFTNLPRVSRGLMHISDWNPDVGLITELCRQGLHLNHNLAFIYL